MQVNDERKTRILTALHVLSVGETDIEYFHSQVDNSWLTDLASDGRWAEMSVDGGGEDANGN